ncbi:4Fe-4S dicluster domain-containing protein [Pannus brasiliensis CCIBt3594]|uniref:4Fe-4S dicluster domain-containing protein n=1 Tax=Pannus brasiliensis CCIBt3594 TaxID=1427578 RepID=A0AAW9QWX4_9CHRO
MQCVTCSGGCPKVERMDLSLRSFVLRVQRGDRETVLNSNTLWNCTSCHTRTSRCPRGVRPSEVIEAVKAIAIREGITNDSTRFNEIFVEFIRKRGILFELELIHEYSDMSSILEQSPLGINAFLSLSDRYRSKNGFYPSRGEGLKVEFLTVSPARDVARLDSCELLTR